MASSLILIIIKRDFEEVILWISLTFFPKSLDFEMKSLNGSDQKLSETDGVNNVETVPRALFRCSCTVTEARQQREGF